MRGIWAGRGLLRRLRGSNADEGVALVMVVGTMLVLASLALVTLGYTMAGQKFARYDQDYAAAMSAAQSGVEDFISRLNHDDQYGSPPDCENIAWQGPDVEGGPAACGWSSTTAVGWAPVTPGDTDPAAPAFHYSVDATEKGANGTVLLTVTGRVNGVYRTIQSAVGKGGSTDYVYYTDFESADPDNEQAYGSGGTSDPACGANGTSTALHWYEGRSSADCQEITFIGADTLDGAVFSNDAVLSNGASFLKGFETAYPNCKTATSTQSTWKNCLRNTGGASSTGNFNGVRPAYSDPLYLPDNTGEFQTDPGCHYYGATRVIFNQSGTVTVYNNPTVNGGKKPVAIGVGGTTPDCGQTATAAQLTAGYTIDVPNNMVIYADTVAGTSAQCDGGQIGGPAGASLPLGTWTNALAAAAPTSLSATLTYDVNMTEDLKACNIGNLYAEGVVKGRVTLAAAASVVVTGDLVLAGGLNGQDMLGLVATQSVEIFHPRMITVSAKCSNTSNNCSTGTLSWRNPGTTQRDPNSSDNTSVSWPRRYKAASESAYTPTKGIQIAGSIQTLQHSFLVQQYDQGSDDLGTLLVNGSIAQRYRGIVGVSDGSGGAQSGFVKLYKYDTRLIYTAPPYFPPWVNAEYTQRYTGEMNTPAGVKQ